MKPGSVLPFRVVERKNARGQLLTPAIVGKWSWMSGDREAQIAVLTAISQAETDANAAYLVHAANAYPKLVALLQELEDDVGTHAASTKIPKIAALLDELGEP